MGTYKHAQTNGLARGVTLLIRLSEQCAQDARCFSGAPGRRWGGDDQAAQRARPWMASPFRADRSPLEKPGHGSRTFRPWMDGKRQPGWPSLLVTFLLATQEKS